MAGDAGRRIPRTTNPRNQEAMRQAPATVNNKMKVSLNVTLHQAHGEQKRTAGNETHSEI